VLTTVLIVAPLAAALVIWLVPMAKGATAGLAVAVVLVELWAIAFIRARYMDTPFLQAVFQIVLGGAIVLAVGILIGGA